MEVETRTQLQVKNIASMIADIYKVGALTYLKLFWCDNGSELKAGVTKVLEKQNHKVQACSHSIHRGFEQATHRSTI